MSIVKLNNNGVKNATAFGSITGLGNLIFIILISGIIYFTSLRLLGFDFNGFFKKTLNSL